MDLHSQLSKNMEQIISQFKSRMDNFDTALEQSKSSCSKVHDLVSLSADYTIFKELMWKTLAMLQQQVQLLTAGFDKHEMHSRRTVLLFHGVPEDDSENTESKISRLIHNHLKLPCIDDACIEACHRLGVKKDRHRPILVRFSNMKHKSSVWNAKTALKGSGVTMSEFLTKPRQETFVAARKHFGIKNCWSSDGVIIVALPDKTRTRMVSLSELQQIISKYPQDTASQEPKLLRTTRRGNKNTAK
ncbi:uncharacterized protein LOC128199597 [Bicyclus anynana]|uniref:Uncharacterized protein LOC128199597 n=1 Tax=Bicyclus anynana TaxID=110368 RepID=A0ABM3M2Q7_BICAN|nr:uncharacterized protein LOC128199597 [Bicyclus anynana]